MNTSRDGTRRELDFKLIKESSPEESHSEMLDMLRTECPSFHASDRRGFWVLTEHETVSAALRDYETFTSESVFVENPDLNRKWPPVMVDPPEHTAWRRLL